MPLTKQMIHVVEVHPSTMLPEIAPMSAYMIPINDRSATNSPRNVMILKGLTEKEFTHQLDEIIEVYLDIFVKMYVKILLKRLE